jgi:hypothetical protein
MNTAVVLQNAVVGLIVAACFVYVLVRYLPVALRRRIVYALARDGAPHARLARWLGTESSCGSGCDTCGSCGDPATAGSDSGAAADPAAPRSTPHARRVIPITPMR